MMSLMAPGSSFRSYRPMLCKMKMSISISLSVKLASSSRTMSNKIVPVHDLNKKK